MEYENIKYDCENFTGKNFDNAVFTDCVFNDCKLSANSLVNTRFQGVSFKNCKIEGFNCSRLNRLCVDISFELCDIISSNFSDLKIKRIKFIKCRIKDTDFIYSELKKADFTGSDLAGSVFHNCDLREAVFEQAVNYNLDPSVNKISKAVFSLPEAVNLLAYLDIKIR